MAEQALSRTSGAPLLEHNRVRILADATENYPAWLAAIAGARKYVHLENYIFQEDATGGRFAEALAAKAREGVTVRVVRDWLGSWRTASRGFWRGLAAAGVSVRCFNPPRWSSPVGWVTRDHRKSLAVDGEVAFVAGLCIADRWEGDARHGMSPWRDTGIEIHGPAVAEVHGAFAQVWEILGDPLPPEETPSAAELAPAGDVALRVVAGTPITAGMLRTDQFLAAMARESLWLTDAYFVGITPYVQALLAAARDGVDVRLLVPQTSDLRLVRAVSRAGFRSLLEGGVRIFEWNGSMLHAKTAVVDGRWSRVGSTNLNLSSFLGNYELDVVIDDSGVAAAMRAMYLADLENATEIVLSHNRVLDAGPPHDRARARRERAVRPRGLVRHKSSAAASAMRVANTVGAAMTDRRLLGPAEGGVLLTSGLVLAAFAVVAVLWPRWLTLPLAALALYFGTTLLARAFVLYRAERRSRLRGEAQPPSRSPPLSPRGATVLRGGAGPRGATP